jgi:hypothetical protein
MFAFRPPVPAYKHNCAQLLHLRGLIPTSEPYPGSPRRIDGDVPVLRSILERLDHLTSDAQALPTSATSPS